MKNTLQSLYAAISAENKLLLQAYEAEYNHLTKIDNHYKVFVSLGDDSSKAYVVFGEGYHFTDALSDIVDTYIKNKPQSFKAKYLKLDIVTEFEQVNNFSIDSKIKSYTQGFDGLSFDTKLNLAFLPEEVKFNNLVTGRKISIKNINNVLKYKLPLKTSNVDADDLENLYTFQTKSYYIGEGNSYELYRGHRLFNELSKEDVLHAINLAKDNYFKNVINKKGKFIYSFLPAENTIEKRYNILRHAGTAYSMLETYELTGDQMMLTYAENAINFLLERIYPMSMNDKETKVVVERDVNKLGGNALAIVFLAKYTELTGDRTHVSLMQGLAAWIKEVQENDGSFGIHKQIYSTKEVTDFKSNFYTGQSILALVRLFELDRDELWLTVATKAADYLVNSQKNATLDSVHQDHWLMYGLNALYRYNPSDHYLEHARLMAKSVIQEQFTEENAKTPEYIGGYPPQSGVMPKSVPTACRSEGLSNVYHLLNDFGYTDEAKEIKKAIHQGIKFQLQMQLRHDTVMYLENKNICLGSFYNQFPKLELRNDFTQHNISSLIAYYKIATS